MKLVPLLALLALTTSAFAQDSTAVTWPDLPTEGFLAGRIATAEDVALGRAQFAIGSDAGAEHIDIVIPQYAILRDEGVQLPGIVLQAEAAQGMRVAAFRPLDGGNTTIVLVDSLELLGQERPR